MSPSIMGADLDAASRIALKVSELEEERSANVRGTPEWARLDNLARYYRLRLRSFTRSDEETEHHARAHAVGLPAPFVVNDDGCWVWQRSTAQTQGYGVLLFEGRRHRAHRLYYSLLVGDPGELPLDHLCRNRACVNPAHLEPVTTAENQRRGIRTKLNPDSVRDIKRALSLGVAQRPLARQYGVDQSTIALISTGKIWGDV